MSDINPKNCPLCDEPPEIEEKYRPNLLENKWQWICTHRCEGAIKFYVEMSDDFLSKDSAVKTWNDWVLETCPFCQANEKLIKEYTRTHGGDK